MPEPDDQLRDALDKALFMWLATTSVDGRPSVEPKELFTHRDGEILVADSKDMCSFDNLLVTTRACIAFIDPLAARCFQIHVDIEIVEGLDPRFQAVVQGRASVIHPDYPFDTVYAARPSSAETLPLPMVLSIPREDWAQMISNRWSARGPN